MVGGYKQVGQTDITITEGIRQPDEKVKVTFLKNCRFYRILETVGTVKTGSSQYFHIY